MKKIHIIFILLITLTFLFSACKDDPYIPVKPPDPTPTDTADWYTWETIEVGGYLFDLYVADSNNIYIWGGAPIFYNGQTFRIVDLWDPEFRSQTIRGYDKNNVFFGGHKTVSDNSYAALKKMTNGIITSFSFENDSNSDIADILPIGPNEAWLSNNGNNNIYFFNNGSSTLYKLDSGGIWGRFFKDAFENLYVFALADDSNSTDLMHTYKFIGNQFELITTDTVQPPSEKTYFIYNCGKDMLMSNFQDVRRIFYFDGLQWLLHPAANNQPVVYKLGGNSKDTLFAFGRDGFDYMVKIWDGVSWRREKGSPAFWGDSFHSYGDKIYIKDERIYFIASFRTDGSFLVIGKPNKKR